MATTGNVNPTSPYSQFMPTKNGAKETDDAERFLTLLVAQYQNQDPLSPMDNSQVTSQMAQINSVSQLTKVNSTLDFLVGRSRHSEGLGALPLVGKTVTMRTDRLAFEDGKASGQLELLDDAESVVVEVLDKNGTVIKTSKLGPMEKGVNQLELDVGKKYDEETYRIRVSATNKAEKPVALQVLTTGVVNKVSMFEDGSMLRLDNKLELPLEYLQSMATQ